MKEQEELNLAVEIFIELHDGVSSRYDYNESIRILRTKFVNFKNKSNDSRIQELQD